MEPGARMISYSQNQEDVVLFRLTSHVRTGTYVDVGAAHPVVHNVTFALYETGWRGLNIEPMSEEAGLLRTTRPGDSTIQAAAGSDRGRTTIYTGPPENRGASTSSRELAEGYRSLGQEFGHEDVDVERVDDLVAREGIGEIHVLKIDVEGSESSVLEGCNLPVLRPWVLVVEATRPNSTVDSSHEWEDRVLECGYVQTLFDGLNKFYVRADLPEIARLLSVPANVFDNWVSWETIEARGELDRTSAEAEEYARTLVERVEDLDRYAGRLEMLLHKSSGWLPERSRPAPD